MLRTSIRVVGVVFLLAVVGGGYWTYRTVWGQPFKFDTLIDRQGIETLMDEPQLLTGLGMAFTVTPLTTYVLASVDAAKVGVASGIKTPRPAWAPCSPLRR